MVPIQLVETKYDQLCCLQLMQAAATLTRYLDACVSDPPFQLLVRSTLLDHLSCPESTAYSSRYCLPGICQQLWADHVTLLSGPQFFGRIYKPFSWGPTGKEYAQAVGGRAHDCFLSFMAALDTDASKGREMKKDSKEGAGDDACSLPYAPRCVTGSLVNQRRLLASWVLKMPPPGDLLQAMEVRQGCTPWCT
jgi:hypothetical protein